LYETSFKKYSDMPVYENEKGILTINIKQNFEKILQDNQRYIEGILQQSIIKCNDVFIMGISSFRVILSPLVI
jgi:hypothetical protein